MINAMPIHGRLTGYRDTYGVFLWNNDKRTTPLTPTRSILHKMNMSNTAPSKNKRQLLEIAWAVLHF
jgi:hypothetical protein